MPTTATSQPAKAGVRKRKAHRKSRQGCSNCKFRRVKCDEARPRCYKCVDYGVDCDYDTVAKGELQNSITGTLMLDVPQTTVAATPSLVSSSLSMINKSLANRHVEFSLPSYQLSGSDFATLQRFQARTVSTVATANTWRVYQAEMLRLASCNPFLMHILLAFTLAHDRSIEKEDKASVAEAYHHWQGLSLFNRMLSRPIKSHERDAVWACAALLGAISFSAIEATSPEEAWPLRSPTYQDLDWLSISEGKKQVARLAYPNGPESAFYSFRPNGFVEMLEEATRDLSTFDSFSEDFIECFGLTPSTEIKANPYHRPATILNQLMKEECNHSTILSFFVFIGHITPEYRQLLQEKDARALLLLSYWFAKMCEYRVWWIVKRVLSECQAVCIYLRRYHWQSHKMQKLLRFPISRCGLEGSAQTEFSYGIFPT